MKTTFSIMPSMLSMLLAFALNTFAQDYTQWSLPEGAKARLGKGEITANVTYSPDGTRLAVASSIGVWIYNVVSPARKPNLLTGHGAPITSVAFSSDGQTIAGGGWGVTITLWDAETGSLLHTLSAREDIVSVAFGPDGKTLAGSNVNGTVYLWDTDTGEHLWAPTTVNRTTLDGHLPTLESVSFSPDGKTLASGSYTDNTVRLWDAKTGSLLHRFTGYTSDVNGIRFSPNGKILASTGSVRSPSTGRLIGAVHLWDTDTRDPLHTLALAGGNPFDSVAFSPDSKTLATAIGAKFFLWDTETGNLLHAPIKPNDDWSIESVAFSPDGKTLASVSRNHHQRVHLWDTDTWQVKTYFDQTGAIESVAFSPDGKDLVCGGRDGKLYYVRNINLSATMETPIDLASITQLESITSVVFSPDSKMLASVSGANRTSLASVSGGDRIVLWDTSTWEPKILAGHTSDVNSVVFSPDGKLLAGGGSFFGESIYLWDTMTGGLLHTLRAPGARVYSIAFSPNRKLLAGGRMKDAPNNPSVLWLWDTTTGSLLRTLTKDWDWVRSVAFSPDGKLMATGSPGQIRLWDTITWQHLKTLNQHSFVYAYDVAFSPDGRTLASGSGDTGDVAIDLWDINTGERLKTLVGHTDRVRSVAFSPDGQILASGSDDGTVLLWSIASTPPVPEKLAGDINADGIVNIQDLVLVAASFGRTGVNAADVNEDGVVNIVDLVLVAGALGGGAGAPLVWSRDLETALTMAQVEQWLRQARQVNLTDPTFQRGITVLERLLAGLPPKETVLLPNYPNPFNPETWIPYQLSEPADVNISIYSVNGKHIRRLDLGHQAVGIYESRSRAAYWDGKNALGEPVASGVYFYTLTAGDFTATRKILILK